MTDDEYAVVPEGTACANPECGHDVDVHAMFGEHWCTAEGCDCDEFEE